MGLITEKLGTLTIALGATTSDTLGSQLSAGQLKTALGFLDALSLYSPQGLAEDVTVQLSPVENPTSSDWVDYALIDTALAEDILTEDALQLLDEASAALETEMLASGGMTAVEDLAFKDLRLVASVPAAASRRFILLGKLLLPC